MNKNTAQIRAAIRVRFLPATDTKGSRFAVSTDDEKSPRRMIVANDYSDTPELNAANAWIDKHLNPRYRGELGPVALRWGRDVFFSWNLTSKKETSA